MPNQICPTMQVPGPTLIVTQGQTVTVNLTNALPAAAGNTSILVPGFQVASQFTTSATNAIVPAAGPFTVVVSGNAFDGGVVYGAGATSPATAGAAVTKVTGTPTAAGQYAMSGGTYTFSSADAGQPVVINWGSGATGVQGLLTQEAAPGQTVTYTFVASLPGTRAYYSGTQSDLQVEMGLYGAIIVLPASVPANCTSGLAAANLMVEASHGETDFRLANSSNQKGAAFDHPGSYDREYLLQFAEMDSNIHRQAFGSGDG